MGDALAYYEAVRARHGSQATMDAQNEVVNNPVRLKKLSKLTPVSISHTEQPAISSSIR